MSPKVKCTIISLFCFVVLLLVYVMLIDKISPQRLFLTDNDIELIQKYVDIKFPDSCKKIYSYYDSRDRYHLYVMAEFDQSDFNVYKQGRLWVSFTELTNSKKNVLTRPIEFRVSNSFLHRDSENMNWWRPDKNHIVWLNERSEQDSNLDEIYRTTELLEKAGDCWRVYIA